MSYPQVKGGSGNEKSYSLPIKNRAKFVKKVKTPTLKVLSRNNTN